ncbi:hypothetical protein vseg_017637 [Gypsophila vaccaria]
MEDQGTLEILHDFSPRIKVYKNGKVERLLEDDSIPASYDSKTGVRSKDVIISDSGLSARIYVPGNLGENTKLPLMIYFHGGAFCLYSSSSSIYHNYLNTLVAEANVIAVSPDYRLAPESPIPACYDDSWAVAHWATVHSDPWLTRWGDPARVYLAGDSAGANIAHQVALRAGPGQTADLILVHPFFGEDGENPLWEFLCPGTEQGRDTRLNPALDPARLRRELGPRRVMVCVGEKDFLKGNAVKYYEVLKDGEEWKGEVVMWESKGRGHVFHLYKPECSEARELLKRVAAFIIRSSSLL